MNQKEGSHAGDTCNHQSRQARSQRRHQHRRHEKEGALKNDLLRQNGKRLGNGDAVDCNTMTSAIRDGSTRTNRINSDLLSNSSFLEIGRVSQKAVVPAKASACTS